MRGKIYLVVIIMLVLGVNSALGALHTNATLRSDSDVDPSLVEEFMQQQVDIGPRYPGSNGSLAFNEWINGVIPSSWQIEIQEFETLGVTLRNYWITSDILPEDSYPSIIIGAHYDSRKRATEDADNPNDPVPGANDGASGVAGGIAMMDHIPEILQKEVGFVFFDGEDQGSGGMPDWPWIVGSTYFVDNMSEEQINATSLFILLDMIADDKLTLRYELRSTVQLRESIWNKGVELGYNTIFLPENGYSLTDDHVPFLNKGIPSVDIIDFNYPEWHTTKDDMEHVSPENAAIVVDTVLEWLKDTQINGTINPSTLPTTYSYPTTNSKTLIQPISIIASVIMLIVIRRKFTTSTY